MACFNNFNDFRELLLSEHSNDPPIKILAEGDSWFAYPRRYVAWGEAANLLQILGESTDFAIFGQPRNGDEIAQMLAPPQKDDLSERLSEIPYDILFFSGGGNDIVGEHDFELYLTDRKPPPGGSDANWRRVFWKPFEHKLQQIRALYCQLIDRVRFYSRNPDIRIVVHTYDLPRPSSQGFELFDAIPIGDSWVEPYMRAAGVPKEEQARIIRSMLSRFQRMLVDLADSDDAGGMLSVVKTQRTISEDEWRNEIHPTPEGFRKIARKIDRRIHQLVEQPVAVDRDRLRFELAPAHERVGR